MDITGRLSLNPTGLLRPRSIRGGKRPPTPLAPRTGRLCGTGRPQGPLKPCEKLCPGRKSPREMCFPLPLWSGLDNLALTLAYNKTTQSCF